jgi:hypothetical protein
MTVEELEELAEWLQQDDEDEDEDDEDEDEDE